MSRAAMEILLILSALLSAVTGAFSGAPAPEAQLHREAQAQSPQMAAPAAFVAAPVADIRAALPEIRLHAAEYAAPSFRLAAAIPLYADRLIE
jgi:hypothetical protein